MASSTSSSFASNATPFILPTITTLLGLTSLASGSFTFKSPYDAICGFGLRPPPSSIANKASSPANHADAFQQAVIKAYGIRNVTGAFTILGLLAMWKVSPIARANAVAAETARKCLGVYLMLDTTTALGDAWIVSTFAETEGLSDEDRKEAKSAGMGHAFVSLPILATGAALFFL